MNESVGAGGTDHDLVLCGVGHFTVVKVIPLTVVLVLRIGGVCRNT